MNENKQKKVSFWTLLIVGAGFTASVIAIISFFYPNLWGENKKKSEINDCTIVVTDFVGDSEVRDVFIRALEKSHLIDSFGVKTIYWPLPPNSSNTEGYLKELKRNIPEKHQILISGNYTSQKTFELFLYCPSDSISKLFNFPKIRKFKLIDTDVDMLKDTLESSGLIFVILNSFSYPEKCDNKYLEKLSKITLQSINKIRDSIIRDEVLVNNAEQNYKMGHFKDSEKAIELAVKTAPNNISNYARKALIKDTLNKFEEAFTDYTFYLANFERANNQLISNYKVRNFRRKMIDRVLRLNDESIFNNNFSKKMIKDELRNDIEFYRQNRNDSLGTDKMILDTEKTIDKINESYVNISGRVKDNFNAPIYLVKIKDGQSVDSVWTDNQGNYSINLLSNNNSLVFSKNGYYPVEKNIDAGQTQNITLNHKMREIKGKVSIGAKPIKDVRIQGYHEQFSTSTNQSGDYIISVPEITTSLSAKHQNFHDQSVSIGNSSTLNFSLVSLITQINGNIKNKSGEALKSALISVSGSQLITQSDLNGRFSVNVPSGHSELKVSLQRYIPQSITLTNETNYNVILKDSMRNIDITVKKNKNSLFHFGIANAKIFLSKKQIGKTNFLGNAHISIPMRIEKLMVQHDSYDTKEINIPTNEDEFVVKLNSYSGVN